MQRNIENFNKLIEVLESDYALKHFDMSDWSSQRAGDDPIKYKEYEDCNTAACIGGWCDIIREAEGEKCFPDSTDTFAWLGLVAKEYHYLFFPTAEAALNKKNYEDYISGNLIAPIYLKDPRKVVPVLKYLRDTGILDWNLAYEDENEH